ncbi:MAG: hypothetical protein P1U56_00760 [Saprospiraceae bacterium]|nr:hypothetical protein [Saprospiraceae bacterium]
MFYFFRRKLKEALSIEKLERSELKDKYFVRTMQWGWLDENMVFVIDDKGDAPRMITMDPWPQQIFLNVDGLKTIKEYVLWVADQYPKNKIPMELDETILDTMDGLLKDGGLIAIKECKTILPLKIKAPNSFKK